MKDLIDDINSIDGVKNAKFLDDRRIKINLYSKKVPGREAHKIKGDLKSISQNLSNTLSQCIGDSIKSWEWIIKPSKKYDRKTGITSQVSDSRPVGHKPAAYKVHVKKTSS